MLINCGLLLGEHGVDVGSLDIHVVFLSQHCRLVILISLGSDILSEFSIAKGLVSLLIFLW